MLKSLANGLFVPEEYKYKKKNNYKQKYYYNNNVNYINPNNNSNTNTTNLNTNFLSKRQKNSTSSSSFNNLELNDNIIFSNANKNSFYCKFKEEIEPKLNKNFNNTCIYLNKNQKHPKFQVPKKIRNNSSSSLYDNEKNYKNKELFFGNGETANHNNSPSFTPNYNLNYISSRNNLTKNNKKLFNKSSFSCLDIERDNTRRLNSLSNKMNDIKKIGFEKYETLILNKNIKKNKLKKSISALSNTIKNYSLNKRKSEKEFQKIQKNNKIILKCAKISREKVKDFSKFQNDNFLHGYNKKYIKIKNDTLCVNNEILRIKKKNRANENHYKKY